MKGKERPLRASARFILRQTWRKDPRVFLYSFLTVPFAVLDRLADVYLVALIVDTVVRGVEQRLLYSVLAFALYRLLSEVVLRRCEWQLSTRGYRLRMRFQTDYAAQYMGMDYAAIESTAGKDTARRAKNAMASVDFRYKSAVETFLPQCAALLANLCGLFAYAGIIALLNPLIIALLVCTAGINLLLQKALVKYDQKDKPRYVPLERRIWYLIKEIQELASAKDIRLYGLKGWLKRLFEENLEKRVRLRARRTRLQYLFIAAVNLANAAFTAYIYFYLIARYRAGAVSIADFLLYFGLITGFNAWLMSIADGIEEMHRSLLLIDDLRTFHDLPALSASATASVSPAQGAIRFDHVSFSYPDGKEVLRDLSFAIAPGEKIAIVGLNGAGKTTLVKLMCGLYAPTGGHIYLDGRDIQACDDRQALFAQFSVVFQDIHLLPATIEKNVTLTETPDRERFHRVLALSGLAEKVASLPEKERTVLVRSVLENAVELSGGEMQKLALARALYKGGSVIILDEPTAALDPLAESEMYRKYHALTRDKTAVFISHRLSSTRFCDRIFYLEGGVIAECGSHEALLARNGAYAHMFRVQSQYYRAEEARV